MVSMRRAVLTIDGKFPFEEMKRIRFNYNAKWQMDVLGGR